MTTILDLPKEILYLIFKEFYHVWDFLKLQRVCRAWYTPGHLTLLKDVEINLRAIQPFINSIDHNPDPAYLKAVKSIDVLSYIHDDPFCLNDELNQKLFYRFPNLKEVVLTAPTFLANFTDETCKTFLMNCPEIEMFTANNEIYPEPEYRDMVYKARLLITEVDLEKLDDLSPYGNISQYISGFPRLRIIKSLRNGTPLRNFRQLLTVLPNTPLLRSIDMGSGNDYDRENSAENYLVSAPKDKQNELIDRLAKIENLWMYCSFGFCVHSFKFAIKYLTGLEYLCISSDDNQNWTAAHTQVFCSLMAGLPRIKSYHIQFNHMNPNVLSTCFATAVREIFPSATNYDETRSLIVIVGGTIDLCVQKSSGKQITLCLDDQITLPEIAQRFFTPAFNNVDNFTLRIVSYDNPKASLYYYNMILGQMPSLKDVVIDITEDFVDKDAGGERCNIELPLVEDLTIRALDDAQFQSLLDSYHCVLPNLKCLTLFKSTGIWRKDMCEFRVELPNYSLETLYLDATPIVTKSYEELCNYENEFFVMEVTVSSTNERYQYKISSDLSSVSRVNDGDLKDFIDCHDYFRVNVAIQSLQNLELFLQRTRPHTEAPPPVMILKNNQWK